jgi:tetratricopeptide (TPR) repeat protein
MIRKSLLALLAAFALPALADDAVSPSAYAKSDDAESLTVYAAKLVVDGHAQAALPFLIQAVELSPECAQAHLQMSLAYAEGGRLDKAAEAYQKYRALSPNGARDEKLELQLASYEAAISKASDHAQVAVKERRKIDL